jgi:putative ATP-binding cassette transporter
MVKIKNFIHDLWSLLRPYWTSEEKRSAWLLLIANIVLTLAMVYMTVLFNQWYNLFYNTLQDKAQDEFFRQIGRFCVLATVYIVIAVYRIYLNQMLQIRWRRWLTDKYLKDWLADRTYYRMQLKGNATDNPDQRIAEDFRLFVDNSLSLGLGFLNAAVTLGSFVGILWSLSGPLEIPLGGATYVIYGYMVWVAIGYAIVGTWLTHKIGKPLIPLNFNQQRYEADFRFNLVRFRENSEGVALYRGEEDELRGFRARFASVVDNWWAIMKRQKLLTFFTVGYNQAAVVFPFVVGAPRYFSGAIQLGGLVQISNAFGQVQGALSWFIGAYNRLRRLEGHRGPSIGFSQGGLLSPGREPHRDGAGSGCRPDNRRPGVAQSRARATHGALARFRNQHSHRARRACANQRAFGFRQEHALSRHRRDLAFRLGAGQAAPRVSVTIFAAASLLSHRHPASGGELSGCGCNFYRCAVVRSACGRRAGTLCESA